MFVNCKKKLIRSKKYYINLTKFNQDIEKNISYITSFGISPWNNGSYNFRALLFWSAYFFLVFRKSS